MGKEGVSMFRMFHRWRQQASLQSKFFMRFMVLLIIVLFCFLAYVSSFVIQPLRSTNEEEKMLQALSISNQLDEYIISQNQLSQRILSNRQVFNILSEGPASANTELGLRQNRTIKNAMFQAIGPRMSIRDMIIYDVQGRRIASFMESEQRDEVFDEDLARRLTDNSQPALNSYILELNSSGIVTFNRKIVDQNGWIYGYLTIELDPAYLQNPTETIADGYVYIIDQEERLIAGRPIEDETRLSRLEISEQGSGMVLNQEGDYITYYRSGVTGWTTYLVTPRESVLGPVYSVLRISILIICGLIIFLFIYMYISTKNLLLPIRSLRNQIARIQYSNLNVRVNNQSHNNELVALHETFQQLLTRLQQSIEREKLAMLEEAKARNSALQAQIAPHFIHNVLYLISIAAQEGHYQAVTKMCKHLSENLRYIVSAAHHHVSLAEELEYTRNYLSLVQVHYEEDLEWEIIADDSAHQVQIPRLSIQPFVENCIEHAFTQVDPPWRLRIEYGLFNGIWAIEIRDNGSGIEQSKIEEIKANIQAANEMEPGLQPGNDWGNMGIVNTVHRLQLMYPNRLFFNIFNNPADQKGITVQIIASLTDEFYG